MKFINDQKMNNEKEKIIQTSAITYSNNNYNYNYIDPLTKPFGINAIITKNRNRANTSIENPSYKNSIYYIVDMYIYLILK